MDFYNTVFELIDMRSFSNLWFWIALAAVWSTTSHYVLGVPWDMVTRADRDGGETARDMELIVDIRVRRLLYIAGVAGLWMVTFGAAALTALALLGFWYRVEFAQALFLLAFPLTGVGLLTLRTARRVAATGASGADLRRLLKRYRLAVQMIGIASIFVTAMWGMYQNLNVGPLGG